MKQNNEIKPKGFFVNLDWDEPIQELDDAEAGQLLKNMFHHSFNRELLETTKIVKMISKMTIFPTLDFNADKYQKTVERNRANGKYGGRRKDENLNVEEPNQSQKNPVGYSGLPVGSVGLPLGYSGLTQKNPEEPKDKERDKVKDIVIERENENNKEIDIATDPQKEKFEKFKKLVQLNLADISGSDHREYYLQVKNLSTSIGWNKFFKIILNCSKVEVLALADEFKIIEQVDAIYNIRRHLNYFLNDLVK